MEAPPHFKSRFFFGWIIRHCCSTDRMQPDWQVELGHRRENWLELLLVERLAGDIRIDQYAAGAEVLDSATGFRDRALDVGKTQRGCKGRETIRMLPAKLGHRVIGDPREIDA